MKTISVYVLVTTVLFVIIGCSPGGGGGESSFRIGYDFERLDKVAIVAVEGSVGSELARDQIADFFAMELLRKGYAPVGRAQVKALLRERQLESTDLATIKGATETGLMLDVPAVLVADIPYFGEEISMTAKMINVEDGSIIWMARGSTKGKGIWASISGLFKLKEVETGIGFGGQENELFGEIAGDELGGPTDGVLSPKEAKKIREIVKTMCKSLPARPARKL